MKYVPALDGVRGVAIVAVLFFHFQYMACGWAGVQVFFVLSGFLITRILHGEASRPFGDYLKRFYWRRTVRIFPLYFAFLFALVAIFSIVGPTDAFRKHWPYLFTYTFNYARIPHGYLSPRYWGPLWSLSVEEQFYLIWPAFIYFLPARWFRPAMALILIATPALRFVIGRHLAASGGEAEWIGNAIYNLTCCQLDAFAAGALAATRSPSKKAAYGQFVLASFVLLATGAINRWSLRPLDLGWSFGYPINLPWNLQYVWGYTLLNFWSVAMIGAACQPGIVSRLFELRPLVYTGKISYGLYVLHVAVRGLIGDHAVLLHHPRRIVAFALYLVVSYAAAHASYHLFEKRFLALKDRFPGARSSDEGRAPVSEPPGLAVEPHGVQSA